MAITPVSLAALTGTLLTGKTNWGPVTPAIGAVFLQIVIDRIGLALLTQPVSWSAELSRDAGATWMSFGGASTVAGQVLDASLAVIAESSFKNRDPLSPPTDANTRLRGSITVGETVVTTVTVRQS